MDHATVDGGRPDGGDGASGGDTELDLDEFVFKVCGAAACAWTST
jgi:hypothetical protein